MRQRVAVRGVLGPEVVPLDGAGVALAYRGTDDVHFLARLEEIDFDLAAHLEVTFVGFVETELCH